MLKEFRDFLMRGNLVDLAVAFVMGVVFAALVGSFVSSFVMPLIAAIIGEPDFSGASSQPARTRTRGRASDQRVIGRPSSTVSGR